MPHYRYTHDDPNKQHLYLGRVAVDSATLLVGDPGYWLGDDPPPAARSWQAWLDALYATDADPTHDLAREPFGEARGLAFMPGYGDGLYEAWADVTEDGIAALHLYFIYDEEEEP